MRRAAVGAAVRSFDRKQRHAVLSWTGNNRCKSVSETAGAATETAGFVECIGVASFAFADQLGAGTLFEVKCLFAIDSITAVYRDYRGGAKAMLGREHTSVSILFRYGPTAQSSSNPEFDAAVDRRGPVAVIFHRGHWCPYCRININALVEAHKALPASAEIVAIMPDRQKFVADLKRQSQMPFPILIDANNGYAISMNLTIWVGAEIEKMMEARRLDPPTFQGNSSWMLPIPATFVVGQDGLIRASFIDPDYRNRMMISDMLAAMR
jgi:peroxiredoxin